ncbi:protein kinase [Sorangium cellulosum]|uniref:Protein kinase n=1 Tax=Sorangium cellulosum TaxID=56 RepID=A0A4P2QL87_SORCE|nr:serine/threonine-protein kinase [Sorangium cellulosum]AUX30807.1 protein kinase [Sorangium cellulosum]
MLTFESGQIIRGKYRLERVLGTGGMGVVIAARHLRLEEPVAIKLLHSWLAQRPDAIERFLREARAASRLTSDHVVRVFDVDLLESGAPFIVMEYLEGMDLRALLGERGPLPIGEAVSYVLDTCEAISEAHALGIVHRDLKPQNLFVARRRDGSVRLKVLDFGISKIVPTPGATGDGFITSTDVMLGSPLYMAPEQLGSPRAVDARVDIWALGVVLYQLLTARMPFEGGSFFETASAIVHGEPVPPRALRDDIPEDLEATILRCLEKEPERRLGTVAALAGAIAPHAVRWSAGSSPGVPPRTPTAPEPSGTTVPLGGPEAAPTLSETGSTRPPSPAPLDVTRICPKELPPREPQEVRPLGPGAVEAVRSRGRRSQARVLLAVLAVAGVLLTAALVRRRSARPPALEPPSSEPPAHAVPVPEAPPPPSPPPVPAEPAATAAPEVEQASPAERARQRPAERARQRPAERARQRPAERARQRPAERARQRPAERAVRKPPPVAPAQAAPDGVGAAPPDADRRPEDGGASSPARDPFGGRRH